MGEGEWREGGEKRWSKSDACFSGWPVAAALRLFTEGLPVEFALKSVGNQGYGLIPMTQGFYVLGPQEHPRECCG